MDEEVGEGEEMVGRAAEAAAVAVGAEDKGDDGSLSEENELTRGRREMERRRTRRTGRARKEEREVGGIEESRGGGRAG